MRFSLPLLPALALFGFAAADAQSCIPGQAQAKLDASDVRARLFNTGGLFWRGGDPVYEVPKGSGLSPAFAAGVWLGGYLDGDLRVAATQYENYEFVPGPLLDASAPPADCDTYDRIWVVSQADIAEYEASGNASADLLEWPASLGAPVADGDGDRDNYDLEAGDRPGLLGTQTAFWVMNDGGAHPETGSDPLGVEVQVLAWAVPNADPAIDQATFYNYRVINRNDAPIDSLVFSFWNDADLGTEFFDDYIGSDPERNLFYFYNADNEDRDGYGSPPPAWGMRFLNAEAGSAMYYYDDFGVTGNPTAEIEYWNYMNARFRGGQALTVGGDGSDPDGERTSFVYSGEPGTYWSEPCATPTCDTSITPNDRRGLLSTAPEMLAPGAYRDYTLALPFAFGTQNYGPDGSVEALKAASDRIQVAFDAGVLGVSSEEDAQPVAAFALGIPYPNPAADRLAVPYSLAEAGTVRLAVYDVLGREAAVLVEGLQPANQTVATIDTGRLVPGLYLVVLTTETARETRRITVTR